MQKSQKFVSKVRREIKEDSKKVLIILILFLAIVGAYFYNSSYYVIVRFDELGALTKNMAAYYNGFKIGKIVSISPDNDFKHTLVRVNLLHRNIDLPQNTIVTLGEFPNGDLYLQFIYPKSPSLKKIKRGDILEGMAPYSLEQFMMGQSISGMTDVVSQQIIKTLNSADAANQEIKLFFKAAAELIQVNNSVIHASVNNTRETSKNLAEMAKNLNQAAKKLNNALDESKLKSTTSNITDASLSIKNAGDNIFKATKDFDNTLQKVDDAANMVKASAKHIETASSGLHETLSRRFGGMRILFGTPVSPKN